MSHNDLAKENVIKWLGEVNSNKDLGKDLYEAISRLTPSVSVEVIVKCPKKINTLLIWRHDDLYGPGWHVPGGVVRFKESLKERVLRTLKKELGVTKTKISGPIGFHEIFNKQRDVRGHFISVVFQAILNEPPEESLKAFNRPLHGHWKWFSKCPENLISNQKSLIGYINDRF